MARSLNKAILIGNLTRDPELRYTPQGNAVCTFSIATNRQWKTESGEMKDEAEFHSIVSWNQLAEICSRMLKKGSRTYVEGRIQSRNWTGQDGQQRKSFEIVISDMLVLDGRRAEGEAPADSISVPDDLGGPQPEAQVAEEAPKEAPKKEKKAKQKKAKEENEEEDIPF